MRLRIALFLSISIWLAPRPAGAATFGTAVPITGSVTDLVMDDARGRVYLVNNTQNRVEVYSASQRRLLSSIGTGDQPLGAAMSRNGKFLYVTAYNASSLNIIDLDSLALTRKVSLPAGPIGIAVGGDERVLISTTGSGTNNADNRILLYDPFSGSYMTVASSLPAPTAPGAPTTGRAFLTSRSQLASSADGRFIIGLTNPTTATRQVFVYEVASASVLRSRTVTNISNVLSVKSDGSRFMAGLSLFDTQTLAIEAQQNAANSLYPFPNNVNFNTQNNQGGSVFAPDDSVLYAAFNIGQLNSTQVNSSQLMIGDPDHLLIKIGLQLPENLTGKMVVTSDGATIYALSQSGFLVVPVSTIYDNPVAMVDNPAILLANDQCGATADSRSFEVRVRNAGRGRITATASVIATGVTFTFPLGGGGAGGGALAPGAGGFGGGAGGGAPGGGFPIILPGGGGIVTIPPGVVPGGPGGAAGAGNPFNLTATQQTQITNTAPTVTRRQEGNDTILRFTVNAGIASSLGTGTPVDFQIQAPEAINIPARIRVYQNNRNAEAQGTILPVPISVSTGEALVDMVSDTTRQRLYIANSGLNRVEVFDMRTNQFADPIEVGQLPRSLAMTPNGRFLYVANTGGESISIIDLEQLAVTGKVKFPQTSYNANFAVVTPSVIAASLSGLQMIMSSGALWKVVNDEALPRPASALFGTATLTAPRTMVSTPGGEYILLLAGNGAAYLYDATSEDYVLSQQVVNAPIQGYFGPVAAGPRGSYYVVNGQVLNSSLTPVTFNGNNATQVSAAASVGGSTIARFIQPVRSTATAALTATPTVQLIDALTGAPRGVANVLEGPLATQVGTTRVNVGARTMAVSGDGATAYVLTSTGLSIAPINSITLPAGGGFPGGGLPGGGGGAPGAGVANLMSINQNGVINAGSYQTRVAAGSVVNIYGQNLASDDKASAAPTLPRLLGGSCVTLNNAPLPLLVSSAGQINAQLPPDLKEGRYTLVVRSVARRTATAGFSVTVSKYAPAPFVLDQSTGQVALYKQGGAPVSASNKAQRDERLVMYATGLGPTTGGKVISGEPSPGNPLAVTGDVKVYFGDKRYSQAEVIVDWSGLVPGVIGVYQIDLRIPGTHMKGDALPVTIHVGGVDSPAAGGPVTPVVAVD